MCIKKKEKKKATHILDRAGVAVCVNVCEVSVPFERVRGYLRRLSDDIDG